MTPQQNDALWIVLGTILFAVIIFVIMGASLGWLL